MTSKTSCFDSAIFKRSLRKTLPLWACYFLFWLFILPGPAISSASTISRNTTTL